MRLLIADDEAPLRNWLRRLILEAWPEAEIVAEAANGDEALAALAVHRPEVAFLDIRMPGRSGLEVAAHLPCPCRVVFVTAYDEFAVQAFEQAATDYLVKPVTPERLAKCLDRLRQTRVEQPSAQLLEQVLARLGHGPAAAPAPLRWLRVGLGDTVRLLDVQEVDYFQAADKYTEAHVGEQVLLVRTPLSELEKGLAPDAFWRIHRSLVVRVAAIREVRRDLMGRLRVHLDLHRDGKHAPLPVSRAHAHLFNRD